MTATGGTYTLVVDVPESLTITVGALGATPFEAGWYAYVGSATGAGGFSRVDRHSELAAGERDTQHWHIDYLLGHDQTAIEAVVTTAGVDAECEIAQGIDGNPVHEFGCSDCTCDAHLFGDTDRDRLLAAVETAHDAVS
jgi:endonuclease-3